MNLPYPGSQSEVGTDNDNGTIHTLLTVRALREKWITFGVG